eukprot:351166-Chlamydomonas_euryale.AAC.4
MVASKQHLPPCIRALRVVWVFQCASVLCVIPPGNLPETWLWPPGFSGRNIFHIFCRQITIIAKSTRPGHGSTAHPGYRVVAH